jgi:hypothetical protein
MSVPPAAADKLRAAVVIPTLLCALQLSLGAVLALTLPDITPVNLHGTVRCDSGAAVQGVWVEGFSGGSHFAATTVGSSGLTAFTYQLPYGGAYQIHVGCGGTPASWQVEPWSDFVRGTGHSFTCYDRRADDRYLTCAP